MDSIYTLLTYTFNITLIGSFFLFCFKCLEFRKNAEAKNYIQSLHAKLSILRINLKAKVKRKSHKYRSLFPVSISAGDPADLALVDMIENKLETGEEIERYFNIARKINSLLVKESSKNRDKDKEKVHEKLVTQHKSELEPGHAVGREDFMGTDFKSELSIIRTIKDMVEISVLLNKKIESYNELNLKSPLPKLSLIKFPSLIDVNRVFATQKNAHEDDSSEAA